MSLLQWEFKVDIPNCLNRSEKSASWPIANSYRENYIKLRGSRPLLLFRFMCDGGNVVWHKAFREVNILLIFQLS